MFVGQAMLNGGYTVTVKLQVALLPQVSLAVAKTVVVPTGKVLPLAGLATMFGGVQPPLAVTVKKTVAPAGPVAAVTMLDGQVMLTVALVVRPIVPGRVIEGDQVAPPSRLTSVKISKKLLIW